MRSTRLRTITGALFKRRVLKLAIEERNMGNYSKLIATIVGALASSGVAFGLLPENLATPEIQASIVTVVTALFTYFAPANTA